MSQSFMACTRHPKGQQKKMKPEVQAFSWACVGWFQLRITWLGMIFDICYKWSQILDKIQLVLI